jgi:hypothetical protein
MELHFAFPSIGLHPGVVPEGNVIQKTNAGS